MIYPTQEKESDEMRDVKKMISPVNLQDGLRRMKKINKDGILLEVSHESDIDKLAIEVNTNDQLKDKILIKKEENLRPKIILHKKRNVRWGSYK